MAAAGGAAAAADAIDELTGMRLHAVRANGVYA